MLKNDEGEQVVGRFNNIEVDYENQQIRAFINDPVTMKKTEVYPNTMERLMESKSYNTLKTRVIPNFKDFINR
jgi:hypothetical protein